MVVKAAKVAAKGIISAKILLLVLLTSVPATKVNQQQELAAVKMEELFVPAVNPGTIWAVVNVINVHLPSSNSQPVVNQVDTVQLYPNVEVGIQV